MSNLYQFLNHNIKYLFHIFNVLIITLFVNNSLAQEIGTVENFTGEFYYLNEEGEKINLDFLDPVILNQDYFTNEGVQLSISLLDETYINFDQNTQFIITDFVDQKNVNPYFIIKVLKGSFTIETGEIPKIKKNSSKIITPIGALVLNGTAVSAGLSDRKNDIYLLTDSFGNQGELLLESSGQDKVISIKPDAGISIEDNNIVTIEINDEVNNKMSEIMNTISDTTIINEENIDRLIEKKIKEGKIADLNGDGIIDVKDGLIEKQKIIENKQEKVDKIINFTSGNSNLLTQIVEKSPGKDGAVVLDKIINTKPDITSGVVENLVSKNAEKFKEISTNSPEILTKTIDTISTNANTKDTQLATIMSKVDGGVASIILDKVIDNKPELLVSVISKVSNTNNNLINDLINSSENLNNKFNNKIVEIATNDINGKDQLKSLISNLDGNASGKILENISKVNPELTKAVINETIKENPNKVQEILAKNLSENSIIADSIIKESIASGKKELITDAVNQLKESQTNPEVDLISVIKDKVNVQVENLKEEGALNETDLQNNILEEILASPN